MAMVPLADTRDIEIMSLFLTHKITILSDTSIALGISANFITFIYELLATTFIIQAKCAVDFDVGAIINISMPGPMPIARKAWLPFPILPRINAARTALQAIAISK